MRLAQAALHCGGFPRGEFLREVWSVAEKVRVDVIGVPLSPSVRKEVDYQKLVPALLIASSLLLAIRTAR